MHRLPRPDRALVLVVVGLASLLLVGTRTAWAEDEPATAARVPILWVVDSKPRIYLFGTIHLADPRVTQHPDVVARALEESGALYTEISLDAPNVQGMVKRMMLPEGETLDQIIPKELYDRTNALFEGKGMPLQLLNRFKIWVVFFRLQLLDADPQAAAGQVALDAALYQDAAKEQKVVGGLETADEQLDIFDNLTTDEQLKLLEETVTQMEKARGAGVNVVEKMLDVYLRGDAEELLRVMYSELDPDDELAVRLMKKIIDDRNVVMVRRMLERAQEHPDKTHFVAVGAGHHPGPAGIVALLEATGFRVKRVRTLADLADPFPLARKPAATAAGASVPARRVAPAARRTWRFGPFCLPEIRWPFCCPCPCPAR